MDSGGNAPELAGSVVRASGIGIHQGYFLMLPVVALLIGCDTPTALPDPPGTSPDTNTTRVDWLQSAAAEIATIDPDWGGLSDLEPLKSEIGDARIVMLGEASHGDGATFLAKTRLIKFLHREMGFDVLAFESGLFDVRKAWELIDRGEDVQTSMRESIFTIWTLSEQLQPLIEYIDETSQSATPLELTGFDCQFSGTISGQYFVRDLLDFLGRYGSSTLSGDTWETERALLQAMSEFEQTDLEMTDGDKTALDTLLGQLQLEVDSIAGVSGEDEPLYWAQLIRSTTGEAMNQWLWSMDHDSARIEATMVRDQQMGENLIWLAQTKYAHRKIVVWAASFHTVRNIREVEWTLYPGYWDDWNTMGHVAWEELGPEIYSLAFTAYDGVSQYWTGAAAMQLDAPRRGGLEWLLHTAGFQYAFLDLRTIPSGGEWLRGTLAARPIQHNDMLADWARHIDGLFFIHTMQGNRKAAN